MLDGLETRHGFSEPASANSLATLLIRSHVQLNAVICYLQTVIFMYSRKS